MSEEIGVKKRRKPPEIVFKSSAEEKERRGQRQMERVQKEKADKEQAERNRAAKFKGGPHKELGRNEAYTYRQNKKRCLFPNQSGTHALACVLLKIKPTRQR